MDESGQARCLEQDDEERDDDSPGCYVSTEVDQRSHCWKDSGKVPQRQ